MQRLLGYFLIALLSLTTVGFAQGAEQVPVDHWTCRELTDLAQKYGAGGNLPTSRTAPGTTVVKDELARDLVNVLGKVADKCAREGEGAVPREDLARLAALREALLHELEGTEAYRQLRETIDRLLVPQNATEPPFLYKYGVNGFIRGEAAGNLRLSDSTYDPGHGQGRFLHRVKPYIYWHPTDYLDIHLEGQEYGFTGGNRGHNLFSLYQGFVEAKIPDSDSVALKAGRQELSYGSTYILGANSFYDGLSYDGLRLRVHPSAPLTVDLFWGTYASPFDTGLIGDLAGGYATYTFSDGNAIEAYVLRDSGATERHDGEHLDIYGLRGTATFGPVSFELEPGYESGRRFNGTTGINDTINAYGGHFDLTYDTILDGNKNRFLAGLAYGSGSRDAANGSNSGREFRNPNNDSSIFGDLGFMVDQSGSTINGHHASGLQVYTLGWGVDIVKELNFTGTGRLFRANAVENGLGSTIGTETDFTLTWDLANDLSLIVGYDRFFTGSFVQGATGSAKDIDYGYVMFQFDLSHKKPRLKPA